LPEAAFPLEHCGVKDYVHRYLDDFYDTEHDIWIIDRNFAFTPKEDMLVDAVIVVVGGGRGQGGPKAADGGGGGSSHSGGRGGNGIVIHIPKR
jgi:hypothetical protein